MRYQKLASTISDEIKTCLLKTDETQIENAAQQIIQSNRIFLAGAGRTGLEVSSFAMRLMHIGYRVYRVGEVVTPAIQKGDLLIVCTGSGETKSMINLATIAKTVGAKVLLFTTKETSSIADIADSAVVIHAKSAKATETASVSIQPMSNLFVQVLCITFDILIILLMEINQINESTLKMNHTNLE